MLRPSTAPRWNRHTKTGRERAAMGGNGRYEAKAALARNSGSRPKLNNASPPDFMNTRLEIDIDLSSSAVTACYRPPPPVPALLPLKLRPSERQAHRQRARSDRARRLRQLVADHAPRVV